MRIFLTFAIRQRLTGWGGWWAGHSNLDFGMIVNEGTDAICKKISRALIFQNNRIKNGGKSILRIREFLYEFQNKKADQ